MSSAPSFLRTFFRGLTRSPRSFVFMYRGYFDAGKGGKPNVVPLAGNLETVEQGDRFSMMWKQLLDDYGLDCFHMTDYCFGFMVVYYCSFSEFPDRFFNSLSITSA